MLSRRKGVTTRAQGLHQMRLVARIRDAAGSAASVRLTALTEQSEHGANGRS